MVNHRKIWIVILLLAVALMSGCASLEKQSTGAAAFAEAGLTYTNGVNPLVDAYYVSRIDSNSVEILMAAQLLGGEEGPKRRMEQLRKNDETLLRAYATLSKIKQHNALLAQYFRTLAAFVSDDSAEGIKKELGGIVGQFRNLGLAATSITIADKSVDLTRATPLLVDVGVNAYKSVQLNEIVARDGQAIAKELAIQQVLVDTLANDLRINTENIYKKTIEAKLAESFAKDRVPKAWRAQRIQHLTRVATIDDASRTASAAIADLRLKWGQFSEGRLQVDGIEGLRDLTTDFVRSIKEAYEILTT